MEIELPSKVTSVIKDEGNHSDDSMPSVDYANEVDEARKSLESSPTFEAHVKYISALRQSGADFAGLRSARESFSSLYPLPPSMWLEWVNDEQSVDPGMATKKYVLETVLSRAISDYLSISLCKHYLTLMLEVNPGGASECIETLRNIGALSHFNESASLWSILIEKGLLKDEEMNSIPLVEHEDADGISEEVEDLVTGCATFEKKLIEAGSNSLPETGLRDDVLKSRYMSYATYLTALNLSSAKSVWERCLSECFLDPSIWLHYAAFLRENVSLSEEKRVLSRARRNVPLDLNGVWTASINNIANRFKKQEVTLENAKRELSDMVQSLALPSSTVAQNGGRTNMSVIVLMCYRTLASSVPSMDDLERILRLNEMGSEGWTNGKFCIANFMFADKNTEACVQHVEDILNTSPMYADVWNRAIHLLIRSGVSNSRIEDVLRKGIDALSSRNGVDSLGRTWVDYHASSTWALSTSYSEIQTILKKRLKALPEQRVRAGNRAVRKPRKEEANVGEKRKTREAPKRRKLVVNVDKNENGNENGNAAGPAGDTKEKANIVYEKNTIFIKNFHYKATEENLLQLFEECGAIKGIRIPLRGDGASKGIAYLEFESEESTEKALKLDEAAILGRTIRVLRSRPPRGGIAPSGSSKRGGRTTRGRGRAAGNRRILLNTAGLDRTVKKADMMDTTTEGGTGVQSEKANDNTAKTQEDFRAMLLGVKKEVTVAKGDKEGDGTEGS